MPLSVDSPVAGDSSAGIGAAIARVLAISGYDVTIVGRRPQVLEAAAGDISNAVGPGGGYVTGQVIGVNGGSVLG
jgi:NADP-dependent 3-hydroxy acid dehydrogenase YdfG